MTEQTRANWINPQWYDIVLVCDTRTGRMRLFSDLLTAVIRPYIEVLCRDLQAQVGSHMHQRRLALPNRPLVERWVAEPPSRRLNLDWYDLVYLVEKQTGQTYLISDLPVWKVFLQIEVVRAYLEEVTRPPLPRERPTAHHQSVRLPWLNEPCD